MSTNYIGFLRRIDKIYNIYREYSDDLKVASMLDNCNQDYGYLINVISKDLESQNVDKIKFIIRVLNYSRSKNVILRKVYNKILTDLDNNILDLRGLDKPSNVFKNNKKGNNIKRSQSYIKDITNRCDLVSFTKVGSDPFYILFVENNLTNSLSYYLLPNKDTLSDEVVSIINLQIRENNINMILND